MRDYTQLNGLALAYVGDAIYEIYVRDHLINQEKQNPISCIVRQRIMFLQMHKLFDSANAGGTSFDRRRRALLSQRKKCQKPYECKNADVTTYRVATGFEALMGYLHLTKQTERMEELIRWCIQKVGEKNG